MRLIYTTISYSFNTDIIGRKNFGGTGYQVETGRLSRLLPDGRLETVLDGLNTPGAVLPMPDGSLYITGETARVLYRIKAPR